MPPLFGGGITPEFNVGPYLNGGPGGPRMGPGGYGMRLGDFSGIVGIGPPTGWMSTGWAYTRSSGLMNGRLPSTSH